MAITLKTLLNVAPFPEEKRKILLENYDNLTDQDKRELSVAAWAALSMLYRTQVEVETKKLLQDIADGKKQYDKIDFENIKQKALGEFTQKLDATETSEDIEEVRKQLASHQRLVGKAEHTPNPEKDSQ